MTGDGRGGGAAGFIRPLGGAEQGLDLMEVGAAACHIVRVVAFDGRAEPDRLGKAFSNLLERRPLLGARITRTAGEAPSFAACDDVPEFTVLERAGDDAWHDEFERQMATPVGIAEDPLIRLRVLTSGEPGGEMVLSCHHAACDGRSLTRFCRDLVSEYEALTRGEPGDPDAAAGIISPPLDELVPTALTPARMQEFLRDYIAQQVETMQAPPGFLLTSERTGEGPRSPALRSYTLVSSSSELEALNARAHAAGTTVHGAVAAAVLRAMLDLGGPDVEDGVGLASTIDVRPYLREPVPVENMGMYVASSHGVFEDVRARPFWDVARGVTDTIRSELESLKPYGGMLILNELVPMMFTREAMNTWPQVTFANLGRLDLPAEESSLKVRSIHGGTPVQGLGPCVFCGVVGLSGTLLFDVLYPYPDVSHETARAFGESVVGYLRAESGVGASA